MKLPPLLLALSLLVNGALAGVLALRPSLAPLAFRDFFARHFSSAGETGPAAPAVVPAAPRPREKLWAELDQGGDLAGLVARLRAAGFPAALIRDIIRTQVNARYDAKIRALQEPDPNTPFWKLKPGFYSISDKRLVEMDQLQRERSKVLRDLFSGDFFATDDISAGQRRQYGNLSRPKIDLVQRIEDDYAAMNSDVRAAMGGITLPEDKEKLALLAREKHADLAAALSPDELADYEMRSSPITNFLRNRLGAFDPSEAEFRAIYQAQLALSDKFPGAVGNIGSIDYQQRQAAQQDLNSQLRTSLGDARYADYARATSTEYQQLSSLAQRANLPDGTAVQAFNLRDTVAQESSRIFDDATLDNDQKRSALQALAQNTRAQLTGLLGPTAGPAYVKIADQWLGTVERGAAVSFDTATEMAFVTNGMTMIYGGSPTYRRLPPIRHGP
jgi:hypothetical protein